MPLTEATLSIKNNGLGAGLAVGNGDDNHYVIGCCSSGTAYQCRPYYDIDTLVSVNGYGPGVQNAAYAMKRTGKPVIFCKVPSSTAGTCGTPDVSAVTGTSVLTATGAPYDTYQMKILFKTGGTIGVAGITFIYSRDNGYTWSGTIALGTAVSYLVPNTNFTWAFAAGTIVALDAASCVSVEPKWVDADITAAYAAIAAREDLYRMIHVVGKVDATNASNIDLGLTALQTVFEYTFAMASARDRNSGESEATWIASLISNFGSFTSERLAMAAGYLRLTSPIDASYYRRPLSWAVAAFEMLDGVERSLAEIDRGPIGGAIVDSNGDLAEHDEVTAPGLQDARFIVARRRKRRPGVYLELPYMMAPAASDFSRVHLRGVMDIACKTAHDQTEAFLSKGVVLGKNGFMKESQLRRLESNVNTALEIRLLQSGKASAAKYVANRNDALATPGTKLTGKVTIVPLGYVEGVSTVVQFSNPAIEALQG